MHPSIVLLVKVMAIFWNNLGKVKPKGCCVVMVEGVNNHRLHPTSILDIYKVFEHLHNKSVDGHMGAHLHCYTPAKIPWETWYQDLGLPLPRPWREKPSEAEQCLLLPQNGGSVDQ